MGDLFTLAVALAQSEASRLAVDPLHFAHYDEPTRLARREVKTACARYVSPRAIATADNVTCPDCRAALAVLDAGSDNPDDVFGEAPTSYPTPTPRFDPLAGYRPKGGARVAPAIAKEEPCSECNGRGTLERLGGDWGKTPEATAPCWKCRGAAGARS